MSSEEIIIVESQGETYLQYYLKHYSRWISILISLYLLLDVIMLFVSIQYSFTQLFLYFGILMILISSGTLAFIYFERNYFWALLGSVLIGLLTTIETIIYLSLVSMNTVSLVLAIFSLLFSIAMIFLPILLVYIKNTKEKTK
ncbi:MAG: hypothetical protein JXA54_08695 [Candidatus Heimdallarchaeota archaeon]|nr:hypothetical protein [Candidatus Heimdallarchaeota archaeon]